MVNEYINKVMLLSNIADNCQAADDAEEYEFWDRAWRYLRGAPTSDVAPVKHGVNIEQEYDPVDRFRCSECGIIIEGYSEVRIDEDDGDETYHEFTIRFCPNCGAKMEDATDV